MGEGPPLLRCNIPVIMVTHSQDAVYTCQGQVRGRFTLKDFPPALLETQVTRTQLEGYRVLVSSFCFPEGSAEIPRTSGDMVVWCQGCMQLSPSVSMGRTGGETEAREASGLWSAANQTA